MKTLKLLRNFLVGALALGAGAVGAASIPLTSGPLDIADMRSTINNLIVSINSLVTPVTMAPPSNYRNFLDNGAIAIQQFGTSAVTGGTTTGCPLSTYVADRWCVDTNVGSGAGQGQVITASPTPPAGFLNAVKVWRNSGALLQPVCLIQEIPKSEAVQLQNQAVVFSAQLAALAALTSASNAINLTVITGTGADEGLGTLTASPAITPAWTGLATAGTATFNPTTTFAKVTSSPIQIPATATEVGVLLCFTPVGSASGATDGFAVTGLQLEVSNTVASSYEFRPLGVELAKAQRYTYVISEGTITAGTIMVGGGTALGTTTTCSTYIPFPVTMRTAPTYTSTLSASTFKLVSASQAATALSTPFSATLGVNTVNGGSINFTTTGMTAKDSCELVSAAGSGSMVFTANF